VRGSDADGRAFAERASLVIGADGRHSVIARQVSAAEYDRLDCPSGALYAYWRGVGPTVAGDDALQFASGPECDTLCCPCDGDLHVTLLIVDNEEFAAVAGNPARYDARLRDVPTLAPRLDGAERVGKIHPASPRELRGFFRHPYGPGWSLIGDAGYYAHPAAAQGIGDALRSGELVHILVERAWAEGLPAETYLADYQRTRDDENRDSFAHSYRLGQVNPFFDPLVAARMLPQATPPIT
jgi:2-polyprenyl-6-methoxyphenol hydroxylase-like FAD-dependent oxidoreductase